MLKKEWGRVFYRGLVKVANIYSNFGSLKIFHRGDWHEIGDQVLAIIKSMDFRWESRVGDFRRHFYRFEVNGIKWMLDFDVVEHALMAGQPKETTLLVSLDQISPREIKFPIIYHPMILQSNKINLEDLLKSSLYRMPHIAEDLSHFANLIHLMDEHFIVIYHDRESTTRIDVVLKHGKLPYYFVVAYHIDKPFFSADLHVVTKGKFFFDTLAEAVIEEYWSDLTVGGER
jgi:hypothetical protein